jgi:hypothetical protein
LVLVERGTEGVVVVPETPVEAGETTLLEGERVGVEEGETAGVDAGLLEAVTVEAWIMVCVIVWVVVMVEVDWALANEETANKRPAAVMENFMLMVVCIERQARMY